MVKKRGFPKETEQHVFFHFKITNNFFKKNFKLVKTNHGTTFLLCFIVFAKGHMLWLQKIEKLNVR